MKERRTVVATTTRTRPSRVTGVADTNFSIIRLFGPATNLQSDRGPLEPESLPELIDEESLVGEMECRRDIGEQHDGRGRRADLCGVHEAHSMAPWADRGVAGGR